MTISEIHQYFKMCLNKDDSLNYPIFEPEEIDLLLNMEMFRIIEQRAYGNNFKRESGEETQKRSDDIKNIIQTSIITSFITDNKCHPNGKFVNLPEDYRHAWEESCIISYNDCNDEVATKIVKVVPMTHDRYNEIVEDPFNTPDESVVIRLIHGKIATNEIFELITGPGITITSYRLVYLRTPLSMRYGTIYSTPTTNVECELSEHLHREIIESAARTALENIESRRFITSTEIYKKETE